MCSFPRHIFQYSLLYIPTSTILLLLYNISITTLLLLLLLYVLITFGIFRRRNPFLAESALISDHLTGVFVDFQRCIYINNYSNLQCSEGLNDHLNPIKTGFFEAILAVIFGIIEVCSKFKQENQERKFQFQSENKLKHNA